MISYHYPSCASCHISPQGRHLLNEYGDGIDDAQSLRPSNGPPPTTWSIKRFNLEGWVIHDLRVLMRAHESPGGNAKGFARLNYRNSTRITDRQRISFTIGVEEPPSKSEVITPYYTEPDRSVLIIDKAVWQFRPRDGVEVQVGRDYLPSPINIADLTTFVRARNRWGEKDYPTQAKLFLWNDKYQVQIYGFLPGFHELKQHQEYGAGLLAEIDVGDGNAVVGLHSQVASSSAMNRQMVGVYTRWGISTDAGLLLEYDVTHRSLKEESHASFFQFATFGKLYWTAYEWIVGALTLQHLRVNPPFTENEYKYGISGSIRWNRHVTVSLGMSQSFSPERDTIVALSLFLKR